ncbi:hypothetical protein LMG28688_04921 [Paraburkholderia caffeinitolerans]|uniref:Uncharacterized protein n=1 Tax=Paraburkholderia caffeinitolerans TaxID=1723730 RepID=A0A6J5GJJ6_9BURK|nr:MULTISPECIES: PAAR-like domain-containing protein [Paraburkholderia]CAB3799354.1 hypothetical protein LMG28688_04921 [Paraburkholderia caffeinitolerans]
MVMVNSSAGGGNDAVSVNATPPFGTPVGYGNHATRSEAIPNVPHIQVGGGPIHNTATVIPSTKGDAGGSMGGVASGTVQSSNRNTNGSSKVFVCGCQVTRNTDPTTQNSTNTQGTGTSASQYIVYVFS